VRERTIEELLLLLKLQVLVVIKLRVLRHYILT